MVRLLLSVLALAVLPGSGAAQGLKLRGCDRPQEPLGVIFAAGTLRYQVDEQGRPIAATVEAESAEGASRAGLQSAAARQLSACRFDTRALPTFFPVTVSQEIRFDSVKIWFSDPIIASDQRSPAPVALLEAAPYPVLDTMPAVDERPRALKCRMPEAPRPRLSSDMSSEELWLNIGEAQRFRMGFIGLAFQVNPDGRVEAGSVEAVAIANPLIKDRAMKMIRSCRFAPGRIGGTPATIRTVQYFYLK